MAQQDQDALGSHLVAEGHGRARGGEHVHRAERGGAHGLAVDGRHAHVGELSPALHEVARRGHRGARDG